VDETADANSSADCAVEARQHSWHGHGIRAHIPASSVGRYQCAGRPRRTARTTPAVTSYYAAEVTIYSCRNMRSVHVVNRTILDMISLCPPGTRSRPGGR
jgi:hypothetical protein